MFLACIIVGLAVVGGRLLEVQVVQNSEWAHAQAVQSLRRTSIPAERGTIYSRDGVELALDVPSDSVVVDPVAVVDEDYTVASLAAVLGLDRAVVRSAIAKKKTPAGKPSHYALLTRGVDANTAQTLRDMGLPGVSVVPQAKRAYPADSLGRVVLGTMALNAMGNLEGATGLESEYQALLAGRPGELIADRDLSGTEIPRSQQRSTAARPGQSIVVTLDQGIQYDAEQTLIDQVTAQRALGGTAVVLDLRSGDILAMASVDRDASTGVVRPTSASGTNRALRGQYSPGSVLKIVTISKALEQGCISPATHFSVPDTMRNGTYTLRDDERHGPMWWTARDILTHSSNVGTAMIARQCFTPAEFDTALRSFGFGARSGLGFKSELSGLLLDPSQYYSTGLASGSIGYGPLVTPMQLLDAYAAIARGGVPVTPRLVRETIDPNGTRHQLHATTGARVVSASTAAVMRDAFANVVREGTGFCAAIPGYEVAGKTGTVRKRTASGYNGGYYASFVGFAPASAPRLAAVVVLDDPAGQYGNVAAAPVFARIMTTALGRAGVRSPAGDQAAATQYAAARTGHSAGCVVPPRPTAAETAAAAGDQSGETPPVAPRANRTVAPQVKQSAPPATGAPKRTSPATATPAG